MPAPLITAVATFHSCIVSISRKIRSKNESYAARSNVTKPYLSIRLHIVARIVMRSTRPSPCFSYCKQQKLGVEAWERG